MSSLSSLIKHQQLITEKEKAHEHKPGNVYLKKRGRITTLSFFNEIRGSAKRYNFFL